MLLNSGLHVYVPITYTGHDCIVKSEAGKHIDIEIKTRSPDAHPYYVVDNFEVRDDFYIVCHTLGSEDYWVLPSSVYEAFSTRQKNGQFLVLSDSKKKQLNQYDRAFFLLKDFGSSRNIKESRLGGVTVRHSASKNGSRTIRGKHFTQRDYEREVLKILSTSKRPMSTKEIVASIFQQMGPQFSRADQEPLTRGRIRWEGTARFAIYQGLKPKGLIEAKSKNQWEITPKGLKAVG